MYEIEYAEGVAKDLENLRAFERKQILDTIEKQLKHEPTRQTRNRKTLEGLTPPWEHVEPVWALRVGKYRVFYDVNAETMVVMIRAIRRKRPGKRTEDIL